MFERFTGEVRETVRRAAELAEAEQASMVEVEHLLTALVDPPASQIGRALESTGITSKSVRAARDREFRSALAIAGVATHRPSPAGAPSQRRGRTTRFAPSAKLALERTLAIASASKQRRITSESLVLAIVSTEVGIVPRLLLELDIDRERVEALVRAAG